MENSSVKLTEFHPFKKTQRDNPHNKEIIFIMSPPTSTGCNAANPVPNVYTFRSTSREAGYNRTHFYNPNMVIHDEGETLAIHHFSTVL